ncbi:hypothetical protein H206_05155 [Candidatus Electrothrix aarhusensis]|uniref:Uncharacterized protein n=1 Tax=Candidatus Electrothrix aarhusensis TaxID=1859131 RepID=A0A3S4TDL4_9BACT|nr:hypothetical protein H206_05155 [Candidatus Electrothrix aarhusensis]
MGLFVTVLNAAQNQSGSFGIRFIKLDQLESAG